jgi:hypothetical protein
MLAVSGANGPDLSAFRNLARICWPRLRFHHLYVRPGFTHPLLPLTADPDADVRDRRHGMLSTMRNIGLLMAKMLGWSGVLFLDDDISGLNVDAVLCAARGLGGLAAVGFPIHTFADNSVVCHANRLSGADQAVFVGASALLIDTSRPFPFFPNVYNEDWLFLYDNVAMRRVGRAAANAVQQQEYNPFLPDRASAEEFGDVIAEGLMAGLHLSSRVFAPTHTDYWRDFLEARRVFIADAADRLAAHMESGSTRDAIAALGAAEERRARITPEYCSWYVQRWRADLTIWATGLSTLRRFDSVGPAADHLGLHASLIGAPT